MLKPHKPQRRAALEVKLVLKLKSVLSWVEKEGEANDVNPLWSINYWVGEPDDLETSNSQRSQRREKDEIFSI